jgi:hypothetical protein
LWPVIIIATRSGIPARTKFRVLDVARPEPVRRWALTARTTPALAVFAQLYAEHRQRPFPSPVDLHFASREVAEAWTVRCEVARRLALQQHRPLWPQLRLVLKMLDERYAGVLVGVVRPS